MKKLKKISTLLVSIFLLIGCLSANTVQASTIVTGQDIVNFASQQLNKPYVWDASGPYSFDCSGLVQYVFAHFGISVPKPTTTQVNFGTYVSKDNLQLGDLIFFNDTYNGPNPTHVGIYAGNNRFIAASSSSGIVKYCDLDSSYWIQHYGTARRIDGVVNSTWVNQINSSTPPLLSNGIVSPYPYSSIDSKSEPNNNSTTNGSFNAGETVKIYAKSGDWFLIDNSTPKWVAAEYIKIPSMPTYATAKVVAPNGAICRENPYSADRNTGVVPYGSTLTIYEGYSGWYLVNISSNLQWIRVNDLQISTLPCYQYGHVDSNSSPLGSVTVPSGTKCYNWPTQNPNNVNATVSYTETCYCYDTLGNGWYLVNKINPQWVYLK